VNPLDTALANLDLAFVGQTLDSDPGGCERCFTAEELRALRGGQVPDETVLSIFGGWVHRWNDFGELVHSLTSQFLRLLVSGRFTGYSYEKIGELFWDAGWMAWPQRDAVHAVLQAWWRDTPDYSKLEFLVPASHEVMPWLREFGRSPAALPELIDRWFYVLASGELEFEGAEATGWLLAHGVGLLARVPGAAADNAAARLADLELIVQSQEEGSK